MDMYWSYKIDRTGAACTVALSGQLDTAARDELTDVLVSQVSKRGTATVQVDLGAVDFLDSSGIAALVWAYEVARTSGRRFCLVHVDGRNRRVLDLTGVLPLLLAS
jgi:anti-sigma B factor antagonist